MKRIFICLSFALLLLTGMQASAQVIDLSTGVLPPSTLIPYGSADDTWTVCFPGNNPALPASYMPTYSTNGIPVGWGSSPYWTLDPAVRWIAPGVSGIQPSSNLPMGDYYYKMTFDLDYVCASTQAVFNFTTIGADDQVNQVIVNSNTHVVAYGFSPLATSVSMAIPSTDLVVGTNTILLRVYNWGIPSSPQSPTGLQINGNLTITGGPNASFCATAATASTLVVTPTSSGTHTWEIYSSPTGCIGSYSYIGTYNFPSVYLSGAGPCYLIKHKIANECGENCFAQSVCYQECDAVTPHECTDLTPPTNLTYNSSTGLLSWTPVPGAVSYEVEIIPNDPECCRASIAMSPRKVTVTGNTYLINWAELGLDFKPSCFSWRVIAKCPNGTSVSSAKQCAFPGSGFPDDHNPKSPATGNKEQGEGISDENTSVKIYPNPAKGAVSIDIATETETSFTVSIDNMDGKTVKTFDNLKTNRNKYTLKWNTESVAKGTYLVKVITPDGHVLVKKLLGE
ncbi:MAG: T9SS type A sorting domain-containing protein [Bacteroidota bacterium]